MSDVVGSANNHPETSSTITFSAVGSSHCNPDVSPAVWSSTVNSSSVNLSGVGSANNQPETSSAVGFTSVGSCHSNPDVFTAVDNLWVLCLFFLSISCCENIIDGRKWILKFTWPPPHIFAWCVIGNFKCVKSCCLFVPLRLLAFKQNWVKQLTWIPRGRKGAP